MSTVAPPAENPTANQKHGIFTVTILKSQLAGRAAKVTAPGHPTRYVPVEMLSLAAGRDAWMREVLVRCSDCKTVVKAGEMDCEMCNDCYEKAGEENRLQDEGA
jgi:hypothetical protein